MRKARNSLCEEELSGSFAKFRFIAHCKVMFREGGVGKRIAERHKVLIFFVKGAARSGTGGKTDFLIQTRSSQDKDGLGLNLCLAKGEAK